MGPLLCCLQEESESCLLRGCGRQDKIETDDFLLICKPFNLSDSSKNLNFVCLAAKKGSIIG